MTRRTRWRAAIAAGVALLLAGPLAPAGAAPRDDADAVFTPLAFEVLASPSPVEGADGRMHLVYELDVANTGGVAVRIDRVQTLAGGKPLGAALAGAALAQRTGAHDGRPGATLGRGVGATLFLDATYPPSRAAPRAIAHAIQLSWRRRGATRRVRLRFEGVEATVDRRPPVELAPPLSGPGWVAVNGCCALSGHRGAVLPIDGTTRVAQRFAIDFLRLDAANRLFVGPADALASYPYFGVPVHAAAPGRVVAARDGLPEEVPGVPPSDTTVQSAGGNHVVVDLGDDRYAFYAHLQTGSVRVRRGDRVRTGQVLGLLGNSGNTTAPHLHFHVMDSPSPLQSDGLPYTFTAFTGQGVVTGQAAGGSVAVVAPGRFAGRQRDRLPLDLQVVDLGPAPR